MAALASYAKKRAARQNDLNKRPPATAVALIPPTEARREARTRPGGALPSGAYAVSLRALGSIRN